jgi:hypothetical protein
VEAKSNSSSSLVQSPGAVHNKTDAQVAYGVGFGRSTYGWKHNFIELPMARSHAKIRTESKGIFETI